MRFITRVHIDGAVWYLDVDSSNLRAGAGPKGLAVRQLKWYVSWVYPIFRGIVSQFVPYLSWAQDI